MNSAHSHSQSHHPRRNHRVDPHTAARRFWVDLLFACLAGAILALTVAAAWSDGIL